MALDTASGSESSGGSNHDDGDEDISSAEVEQDGIVGESDEASSGLEGGHDDSVLWA